MAAKAALYSRRVDEELLSLNTIAPESPLLSGLTPAAMRRLRQLAVRRSYRPGEVLFVEGADDPNLYLIKRGRVRVTRATSDGAHVHVLSELGPGQSVGEMKVVSPAPASATVVAIDDCDVECIDVLRLHREEDPSHLRELILSNIASILAERLRGTSGQTVDVMQAELEQARLRESAGRFIVFVFSLMSGFGVLMALLEVLGPHRPGQTILSLLLTIASAVPVAFLLRRSPDPPATFGLTLERPLAVVVEAALLSLPLLVLVTAAKALYVHADPGAPGRLLFDPAAPLHGSFSWPRWTFAVLAYWAVAAAQELFARAGLQALLERFIPRRDGGTNWLAILLSNLIFGSAHAFIGFRFIFAAFVPGLFWGWLFHRQRSLLGVAVSHALVGTWALFIVGLQALIVGH